MRTEKTDTYAGGGSCFQKFLSHLLLSSGSPVCLCPRRAPASFHCNFSFHFDLSSSWLFEMSHLATYRGQSTLMSSSAPTWNFLCTRSRAAGDHRLPSVSPHGFPKCPMRGTAKSSPLRGHRLLISISHATEPLQPIRGSALTSPTRIHLHTDSSVIEDGPLVGLKKWVLWDDPARAHSGGTVQPLTPSSSPACVYAQRIIPLKPTHAGPAWKTAWLACSSGFAKVCARLGHLVSQAKFTSLNILPPSKCPASWTKLLGT